MHVNECEVKYVIKFRAKNSFIYLGLILYHYIYSLPHGFYTQISAGILIILYQRLRVVYSLQFIWLTKLY